jgi:hypothetical protein
MSCVDQILIIPSLPLAVKKYCESSVTAKQLTGFLCSYNVVINLPVGLQLLNLELSAPNV